MTVDDRTRFNMHRKLEEVLGEQEADTLMAHLPPVTWAQVATKDDLRTLETSLRAEMHIGFAELRGEIAGVRTEFGGEIAGLRTEFGGEIAGLRTELRTEIAGVRTELANSTNRIIKWMVTFAMAWSTLLVTAVRLIP